MAGTGWGRREWLEAGPEVSGGGHAVKARAATFIAVGLTCYPGETLWQGLARFGCIALKLRGYLQVREGRGLEG